MPFSIRINFLILLLFFSCLSDCNISKTDDAPKAKNGILDLTKWNWDERRITELSGEWKFYWNQVIPENQDHPDSKTKSRFLLNKAPSVWNGIDFFGETVESYGFATYKLRILIPKGGANFALSIPDEGTAYNLYANGELIAHAGKFGVTKETASAKYDPQIAPLPHSDTIDLTLHISNFQNRWGGYWYPIRIGKLEEVYKEKQIKNGIEFAVCISAAIMAVYNLLFYLFRRTDPTPLLFAIHCTLIFIRALTTGERFGHQMFPELSWELLNRLEYISVYLSAPVLYSFLYRFSPTQFWEKYGSYLCFPLYAVSAAALLLPNQIYTLTLIPTQIYCFLTVIPCWMILLIYGIVKKYEGVWILFIGYIGVMYCTINDIVVTNSSFNSVYLIPYGQLFLIASHSILISRRFSTSLNKSENLSHQMKTLVSSTREIMSSSSFASATKTALEILSKNVRKNQKLFIYLPEQNSSNWKQYSIDTENDLRVSEVSGFLSHDTAEVNLSSLSFPSLLNDRLLLPVQSNRTNFVILDLPTQGFLNLDSEMDWVQGIAYALALSIQNLLRQDRDKLAVIGELSAEIAHDIGHHVMLIQKILRNMDRNTNEAPHISIAQAKKETEALANLSLDILEFSKKRIILDLKTIDIEEYFHGVKEDLELFFGGTGIVLTFEILTSGKVKLDPLRIRRLVLNIAKNAADAIGEKGNFSVKIERESEMLYIVFKDDGPGLSEDLKRAFYGSMIETKKPQGTGLGLSIVRKIAIAHGGEVLLDSSPGKGSRFTLLLPC
ncbi:sensor histidine kinase [Leptospira sp. 201903070]|uniref:histidine kinase n=1 Tax=Leptospira ainlahdjerensis TaxID=2810033 RepID=A0ABS2U7R6_9LEPT|nr:sensor histidine kinase [Leptospira ainlahdjerensis]MBM9576417.1 sensor histidine kinase [Leptospira ainlahdjerensis]